MREILIRREVESDRREVENITREAFWNLYTPGCNEHYLVHTMRDSADFIEALDFVILADNELAGNIVYTHSHIELPQGGVFDTITFGPVSVLPKHQHTGLGSELIQHSLDAARHLGYKAVIIYGYPDYYRRFGFVQSKAFGITDQEGKYPYAMLVLELEDGCLTGIKGKFVQNDSLFYPDEQDVAAFDASFPVKEKKENTESQLRFAAAVSQYL